tara:strand:- start:278 stop:766 length:489 start_codon:yes stop_codon:yes gene_type:complete
MAIIGVGNVIQVVYWDSEAVTNITNANSESAITASQSPTLTTKGLNSNFIYCCTLGAESDLSEATNGFFRLTYSTNDFSSTSYVNSTECQVAGMTWDTVSGTNDHCITTSYSGSHAIGTSVRFRLNFTKTTAPSYQFNQQGLTGQPSGTGNSAYGYVMEIGA